MSTPFDWGEDASVASGVATFETLGSGNHHDYTPNTITLPGGRSLIAISGMFCSSIGLADDGTVWAWGSNYGDPYVLSSGSALNPIPQRGSQLGIGSVDAVTVHHATPTQVPGLSGITTIDSGAFGAFALDSSGNLYGWGPNGTGMLGLGDQLGRSSPTLCATSVANVQCSEVATVIKKLNGTFQWAGQHPNGSTAFPGMGTPNLSWVTPQALPGGRAFAFILEMGAPDAGTVTTDGRQWGDSRTLAIATDGTSWGLGRNVGAELGQGFGTFSNAWLQLSFASSPGPVFLRGAREFVTWAYYGDGTLWAIGNKAYAGAGATGFTTTPIQITLPSALNAMPNVCSGPPCPGYVGVDKSVYIFAGFYGDGTTTFHTGIAPHKMTTLGAGALDWYYSNYSCQWAGTSPVSVAKGAAWVAVIG